MPTFTHGRGVELPIEILPTRLSIVPGSGKRGVLMTSRALGRISKEDMRRAKIQRRQFLRPLDVMYEDPATIAFWADGTKTIARCHKTDKYDPVLGFLVCVAKHYFGSGAELHRVLEDVLPTPVEDPSADPSADR